MPMAAAIRDEVPEELRLYGVLVRAIDYSTLKSIADRLVDVTFVDVPKSKARRRAVELAQDAVGQMRRWNGQQ